MRIVEEIWLFILQIGFMFLSAEWMFGILIGMIGKIFYVFTTTIKSKKAGRFEKLSESRAPPHHTLTAFL